MSIAGTSLLVQVAFIADGKTGDKYVFVRRLEEGEFCVTSKTTLGGCEVASLGFSPRTREPVGSILTLILKHRSDLGRLSVGQQVLVEHVQLIEPKPPAI